MGISINRMLVPVEKNLAYPLDNTSEVRSRGDYKTYNMQIGYL